MHTLVRLRADISFLQVRWSRQKDFFVENLFHHECEDYEAARAHYHFGIKNKIMVRRSHVTDWLFIQACWDRGIVFITVQNRYFPSYL